MNYVDGEFYTIKVDGRDYYLEVANSPRSRAKGLMEREDIGDSDGMIFIYPIKFIYPMWMYGMKFSVDIIWLNKDFEVVYRKNSVRPRKNIFDAFSSIIIPTKLSKYVVELKV